MVTCGTDSLKELASFLPSTVRSARPVVVVVGAMRSAGTPGYEGGANLLDGFRVAAQPESRGRGVMVVLNDEIHSAREVTKTDALRLQTFQSGSYGLMGVVDPDRIVFFRDPLKRHTATSEFDLTGVSALPRVDILLFYQGAPDDLVRAAVDNGARGLVIAMAGADVTGGSLAPGIGYAIRKGIPVVAATRTGSGRIAPASASRLGEGLVAAEDLAPAQGADPADAGADEDPVGAGDSADVHGILRTPRPDGLTASEPVRYHGPLVVPTRGPVAQLGARMNGIHEVAGSIPAWSTTSSLL